MKNQINDLKNIIKVLFNSIVKDEEVEQKCLERMSKTNNNSVKEVE